MLSRPLLMGVGRMGDLNELAERLRSDAAQLIRMAKVTEFGKDLSVRVAAPDLLIGSLVEAAAALTSLIAERDGLRELVSSSEADRYRSCSELLERALAAEAQLKAARGHIEQLSELLKIIKEAWVDYDHVYSISVHEADEFLAALSLDTNKGDGNG